MQGLELKILYKKVVGHRCFTGVYGCRDVGLQRCRDVGLQGCKVEKLLRFKSTPIHDVVVELVHLLPLCGQVRSMSDSDPESLED